MVTQHLKRSARIAIFRHPESIAPVLRRTAGRVFRAIAAVVVPGLQPLKVCSNQFLGEEREF